MSFSLSASFAYAAVAAALAQAPPAPPVPPAELDPGVTFRIYQVEDDLKAIPRLIADQTPNVDELRATIDFRDAAAFGNVTPPLVSYVISWLSIETAGEYAFRLTSDDGSKLLIDGELAIDNDGTHGAQAVESAAIELQPGLHGLRIEHFDHAGQKRLTLEWRPPHSAEFALVPTSALRAERDLTRVTSPGFKRIDDGRRPGDGKPVEGVHPGWELTTIRPEDFQPMIGAMTFASDGRLIVGTFNPLQRDDRTLPDIESKQPDKLFALSNVTSGDPAKITVSVCADGLYEPAGLCAVGDDLYVSHRHEITRLRDVDHDGFYEMHETVASGWEAWNYHQFTFGLVHRDGKLYATLSTAMAPPGWEGMGTNAAPNGPMRGCVLEVDLASRDSHVIAGGLRAPNGIGFGPEGSLFYLDNQGAWMPASQLCEVIPGRFYGHHNRTNLVPKLAERFPDGGAASALCDRPRTPASVLLPHGEISNSPTQPALITKGPFAGQMYLGELTAGGIRRVFLERINGQWQGAVFQFTQGFESGVNRLIWGPDGALYAGGIGAGGDWNWRGTKFGLQRLAPTGKNAFEYHSMRALPDGFAVHFTKPVDRTWLENPANYTVKQWTYKPTKDYGGQKIDEQSLTVSRAVASNDGGTVTLTIDGLKEGYCIYLQCDPVSLDGEKIWATEAWYTLNQIPRAPPTSLPERSTKIAGERIDPEAHGVGLNVLPPANAATLIGASADVVFRRGTEAQLPREGKRSPDELMALPGYVEIVPGSGDLITSSVFGDARLHVEWRCPPGGEGQMAGNSGVYLQDLYEIQVLGTLAGDARPKLDDAGAIYNFKAADVNASTGPGHWQAYDIWFRAPRFENGKKLADARVTVYWNGVLVHNDVAMPTPTGSKKAGGEPGATPESTIQLGPLRLQDHPTQAQGGVRYRNVWIAPLHDERYEAGEWRDMLGEMKVSAKGLPEGWVVRGGEANFRLDHNEVVGSSRPNAPNTFLVTQREYGDFELLLEYRHEGLLNSGVQIRSEVIGGFDNRSGGLRGMQVEIDGTDRGYSAGLYDEQRRGWLHRMIDAPYARSAYRRGANGGAGEWNRLRIVAQGPLVRTWINGVPAAEVFDAMDARGHIGLQVHGVGDEAQPMEIRFRNLRIRELTPIP